MRRRAFTAWYDADEGELTELAFSEAFDGESALMRADVLQDVLGRIEDALDEAREEAFGAEVSQPLR